MLLYVLDKAGWDADFENADRIYLMATDYQWAGAVTPNSPYPLGPVMQEEFPEIEIAARAQFMYYGTVKLGEEYIFERYLYSADPEILDVFSIGVVEGNPDRLLENPSSIAISRHIASKYFQGESAMGKVLSVMIKGQPREFQVTGVFEDFPRKSTFKVQFIAPIQVSYDFITEAYQKLNLNLDDDWTTAGHWYTYVLMSEDADPADVQQKLSALAEPKFTPQYPTDFILYELQKIYFHSGHMRNNQFPQGDLKSLYILVLIALSILILACVNYVILSTAQTTTRLSEIGVRKTVGATRRALIFQILGESVLLSILALPIALGLMELALPHINQLFRMYLKISLLDNWRFTAGMALVTVAAGLLSGAYIAIYQSAVQPIDVLRRRPLLRAGKFGLRRLLVILQLIVFVALVSCAAIVHLQVHHAVSRDPGFDKAHLLLASPSDDSFARNFELFRNEALTIPDVVRVTAANRFPPDDSRGVVKIPTAADSSISVLAESFSVDYDYVQTMGLTVVEGRDFSRERDQPGSGRIILNETAVKALGYESVVEKTIGHHFHVVGVIRDFSAHSVRSGIDPMMLSLNTEYIHQAAVRFGRGQKESVREELNQVWAKYFPDDSRGFYTYEEQIPYLYTDEKRVGEIVTYSALIAVFICCMGMFGLSLFVTRSRTKEIGIRKTFGASTSSVVRILVREYVWLVAIATVLSVPITYYFMNRWLENFVYRISLSWYVFVGSGLVALIVALATVSVQAFLAARANPVDSLRYE